MIQWDVFYVLENMLVLKILTGGILLETLVVIAWKLLTTLEEVCNFDNS